MSELLRAVAWDALVGNTPVKDQSLSHPYVKLSIDLIQEEVNGSGELLDSYNRGDLIGVIDGIGDSFKVLAQLCYALDVSPEEILKEINDSNYTKFCYNIEDATLSVDRYAQDGRYFGVHYIKELIYQPDAEVASTKSYQSQPTNIYIIKGWKVGQDMKVDMPKVLKGVHYKEPQLGKFIHE